MKNLIVSLYFKIGVDVLGFEQFFAHQIYEMIVPGRRINEMLQDKIIPKSKRYGFEQFYFDKFID